MRYKARSIFTISAIVLTASCATKQMPDNSKPTCEEIEILDGCYCLENIGKDAVPKVDAHLICPL